MTTRDSLAALGENGLVRLLTGHWKTDPDRVLTGVGDDCAVLCGEGKNHFLVFKTDAVVEGVHFTPQEKPELIGRKALARVLSDLAAMGAFPLAAVITLGVPGDESVRRLRAIYRGIERLAKKYCVNLVGGETTRAKQLFLNVALLGECRGYRPVLRSGARAGDSIFVTGRLGATRARRHLLFEPRLAEGQWLAPAEDRLVPDGPQRRAGSRFASPRPGLGCRFSAQSRGHSPVRRRNAARGDQRWRRLRTPFHYKVSFRKNFEKEVAIRHAVALYWSHGASR